jgi:hypothetical protein
MSKLWFNIIGFIVIITFLTGAALFVIGLEKPNKKTNTDTYDTLKWVGIVLLIIGGICLLIWLYYKFSKFRNVFDKFYNVKSYDMNNTLRNF